MQTTTTVAQNKENLHTVLHQKETHLSAQVANQNLGFA